MKLFDKNTSGVSLSFVLHSYLLKLFYSLNEILILITTYMYDAWRIQHMNHTYKLVINTLRVLGKHLATLIY